MKKFAFFMLLLVVGGETKNMTIWKTCRTKAKQNCSSELTPYLKKEKDCGSYKHFLHCAAGVADKECYELFRVSHPCHSSRQEKVTVHSSVVLSALAVTLLILNKVQV
ncbi:uncharacterized protein LOC128249944 [Octopus bimaculoides]|uniref:uncharacterized protein LOC128249944 n=1 Tax=Octopus bimaculoides TaxID=37653 RepID=UPI0022DF70F4|nr:uncharacterized protein LOC128249944 [Octopus bimaculoides]